MRQWPSAHLQELPFRFTSVGTVVTRVRNDLEGDHDAS